MRRLEIHLSSVVKRLRPGGPLSNGTVSGSTPGGLTDDLGAELTDSGAAVLTES